MKKTVFYILLALTISSCDFRKPNINKVKKTKIEIEDPERHYHPILRGTELTAAYKFYNRGNEPLIIYDVQASCGCIKIKYPSNPIGKNDFGFITLDYDSSKNIGFVEFYITIIANTEKDTFTTIKFDLNVVTSPHYTKDYEEIYLKRRKEKIGGGVDGDLTQQGYYKDGENEEDLKEEEDMKVEEGQDDQKDEDNQEDEVNSKIENKKKLKYQSVLDLIQKLQIQKVEVKEEDSILDIFGIAKNQHEKNLILDEIKKIGGENPSDIKANIKIVDDTTYVKHIVKKGETIRIISKYYYGSKKKYTIIIEANKDILKNPNVIHPGQELTIPNL